MLTEKNIKQIQKRCVRWVDGGWTYDEHPNRRLVSAGRPLTSFFVLMENVLELQKIGFDMNIIFGWFSVKNTYVR